MLNFFTSWLCDESGAITVDWVVLTAAVIGLAIAAIAVAHSGIDNISGRIAQGVTAVEVE